MFSPHDWAQSYTLAFRQFWSISKIVLLADPPFPTFFLTIPMTLMHPQWPQTPTLSLAAGFLFLRVFWDILIMICNFFFPFRTWGTCPFSWSTRSWVSINCRKDAWIAPNHVNKSLNKWFASPSKSYLQSSLFPPKAFSSQSPFFFICDKDLILFFGEV